MSTRGAPDNEDTPLGITEEQALRRLIEPIAPRPVLKPGESQLWGLRYRVMEAIGRGGMGDVYLASDVLLDRQVALKVLRPTSDESFVDARRLLREARAAARVEHERVARVYDVGTCEDGSFIAMEYVRGETLRAWMREHAPTPTEVVTMLLQLTDGLRALHERGIIHRDLKPENVMVTPEGALKILDLGIARRVPLPVGSFSGHGGIPDGTVSFGVGTPGYMAPEQWRGEQADARADIFALGVIAYELVARHAPFRGETNRAIRDETLAANPSFAGPLWAETPAALRAMVTRALAREPADRFHDVAAIEDRIAPLVRTEVTPSSHARRSRSRAPNVESPTRESLAASVLVPVPSRRGVTRSSWSLAGVGLIALLAVALGSQPSVPPLESGIPSASDMVRLEGGSFHMGTEESVLATLCAAHTGGCPPNASLETPPRPRTVRPFAIDIHEVTTEAFAAFLNDIGGLTHVTDDADDHYPRFVRYLSQAGDDPLLLDLYPPQSGLELVDRSTLKVRPEFAKLPITLVTWLGAYLFCKNAGKRLPTEPEWELAARGQAERLYPWGNEPPECGPVHVPSDGWLDVAAPSGCDNARSIPFPVMTAAEDVTPEGVFDLGGNVVEWVDAELVAGDQDVLHSRQPRADSAAIVRGGAFNASFMTRSAGKNHRMAFNVADNLGFRCARDLPN
jgi:serine/threonine protein kinase